DPSLLGARLPGLARRLLPARLLRHLASGALLGRRLHGAVPGPVRRGLGSDLLRGLLGALLGGFLGDLLAASALAGRLARTDQVDRLLERGLLGLGALGQ